MPRALLLLAACSLGTGAAVHAQLVAYSNLGPGDSFDEQHWAFKPRCDKEGFTGDGFACIPERSGVLQRVDLALQHLEGFNFWLLGVGDRRWLVSGALEPGVLASVDVSEAGLELTEGVPVFITILHAGPCCVTEPSYARWYQNDQGAQMKAGLEVFRQVCDDGGPVAKPLKGPEPAFRLVLQDPCPADCDGSQDLSLFDFLCFVNLFNAGDGGADCTGDKALDLFDFLCFTNAFNAGC
jgi:hypothetical protein